MKALWHYCANVTAAAIDNCFTNVHIVISALSLPLVSQRCARFTNLSLLVRRISLCYVCKLRLKVWLIRKKLQKHFFCWSQSDHVERWFVKKIRNSLKRGPKTPKYTLYIPNFFSQKLCTLLQTKWSSSTMNVYFTLLWGKQCKQVMPNYGQCLEHFGSRLECVSDMSILPYAVLSIPAHRRQNSVIHCHAYHPWCRSPAAYSTSCANRKIMV